VYSIIFESIAFEDIAKAKKYYRAISDSLAEKFQIAIDQCLEDLESNPYIYQKRIKESRFIKVGIFPYVVVYVIENDIVIVDAVFASKQNPDKLSI